MINSPLTIVMKRGGRPHGRPRSFLTTRTRWVAASGASRCLQIGVGEPMGGDRRASQLLPLDVARRSRPLGAGPLPIANRFGLAVREAGWLGVADPAQQRLHVLADARSLIVAHVSTASTRDRPPCRLWPASDVRRPKSVRQITKPRTGRKFREKCGSEFPQTSLSARASKITRKKPAGSKDPHQRGGRLFDGSTPIGGSGGPTAGTVLGDVKSHVRSASGSSRVPSEASKPPARGVCAGVTTCFGAGSAGRVCSSDGPTGVRVASINC